jgi:recombination protein RecT
MSESRELSPVAQVCNTLLQPAFKEKLQTALPDGVDVDRFTRVAMTAIQQNPSVCNADRNSLFTSVIRCAQDGLLPNGKEAALVVFGQQVQYMPMIGGLRKIAANHGIIMATGVVHKNDTFEYELGVEPRKRHVPAPLDQDRGEPIGAWAEAKDAEGNIYLEVMGKQDIESVRSSSRARNGDLWMKHWGEAARKTVGRRLFKSLPLADKLTEAETRIMAAADAEHVFDQAPATDTAQQAGPRRPRGLDKVAAAAQSETPSDVIEGEIVQPGDTGGDEPEAESHF